MSALLRLGESLFPYLFDAVWKGTALVVLVFGLARVIGRRYLAARYWIWVYCLTGLLLLPASSFVAGDYRFALLPAKEETVVSRVASDFSGPVSDGVGALPVAEAPDRLFPSEPVPTTPASNVANTNIASVTSTTAQDSAAQPIHRKVIRATGFRWRAWIGLAWFAGCAILLVRLLFAAMCILRLRRFSSPVDDSAISELFEAAKESAGVRTKAKLRVVTKVSSPVFVGILRPTIVLPKSLIRQMPREHLRPILLHELAHIHWGDYAVNILQRIVEAVYFFHPLVWLINRRLRSLREEICDDWVVDHSSDRAGYARALAELAGRSLGPRPNRVATLGLFVHCTRIRRRIERILSSEKRPAITLGLKTSVVLLSVSLAIVGFLSLTSLSARAVKQTAKAEVQKGDTPAIVEREELKRVSFTKTAPRFMRYELPPLPVLLMDDGRAMIPAQRIWSDTGMDLNEGQIVSVSASGQVRGCNQPPTSWAFGPWGPEGMMCGEPEYQGNKACALIGKVESADSVEEFYIGKELTFKAPIGGRFYFGVADLFHMDNEAAFVAEVKIDGKRIEFKAAKPAKPAAEEVKAAPGSFIDLDPYVNQGMSGIHFPYVSLLLNPGEQQIAGIVFRIGKGIVQLSGPILEESAPGRFPREVKGIRVGLKFKKLQILHATGWGAGPHAVADGTRIGNYVIRYEDDSIEEIPIKYGNHVRDWWSTYGDASEVSEGKVAEVEGKTEDFSVPRRLFTMTWDNPHPDKVITTIDFTSTGTVCAPFLVALTAEAEGAAPPAAEVIESKEVKPEPKKEKGYEQAFFDLYDELGRNYPCLELKGIDWKRAREELIPRAKDVKTDEEFGRLCMELVARLEDSHAYLMNGTAQVPSVPFPRWDPGFACLIDDRGKPVVYYVDRGGPAEAAGVQVGMTVASINGESAVESMERRMKEVGKYSGYSSDRYLLYHVAQWLGRQMDKGAMVELEMQDGEGETHKLKVPATFDVRYLPRLPVPIAGISDSGNVSWTMLDDSVGYIYVRRIRDDLTERLDRAVGQLKDARGLIVDVRGNSGGGFDAGRALRNFALDDNQEPNRPRFTGPIALLTDSRCISAGEGWASWFIANKRAKVFGETTAGASSRKTVYTLTNGLFKVQYPVKAYTGFLDRPIERRGLEPDVPVRQNAKDLATGRDTVLETAKRHLLEQTPEYATPTSPPVAEAAAPAAAAEVKTEEHVPPDYEGYFPDDPEGGRKLDALGESGIFQSALSDEEILGIVRRGLRRTTNRWILRAVGNRYVWGKRPQNPKAIEIMYHATDGPDLSNAVYFGLSVVENKSPSILRALANICMRSDDPNVLSRIAWGTKSQRDQILTYVTPYLNASDEATREKARIVERILKGELSAWTWSTKKARAKAEAGFTDKLPEIKEKLLHGDSETRTEVLKLISANAITLIMDDSFIEAWKACAKDPDPKIRNQVARTFGGHWIWNAREQKPEAIELMLQLSKDEVPEVRYNAVYFGLSTVRNKSEAVVMRLLEMAMKDRVWDMFQRICWGLRDSKELAAKILDGYMDRHETDRELASAAFSIYKEIVGKPAPLPERFLVVYVGGQVNRPGQVLFRDRGEMTLLQAIARAGGLTQIAREKVILTTTSDAGEEKRMVIDMSEISKNLELDPSLKAGDNIFVPERIPGP